MKPTMLTAQEHELAYTHFNREVFQGKLTSCLITLSRTRNAKGYYRQDSFQHAESAQRTDEIGMNPGTFESLTDYLSTLVHEMVHHWQKEFGKPGKGAYHNREWARKMLEVGLEPVSLDQKGKMTGRRVTHVVVPGGVFDQACRKLLSGGFRLHWTEAHPQESAFDPNESPEDRADREALEAKERRRKEKARQNKTPFYCAGCGARIWGKPSTRVMCADCKVMFVSDHVPGSTL